MRTRLIVVATTAVLAAALAAAFFFVPSLWPAIRALAPSGPGWEAVNSAVPTGKAVRLEVRVKGRPAMPPAPQLYRGR